MNTIPQQNTPPLPVFNDDDPPVPVKIIAPETAVGNSSAGVKPKPKKADKSRPLNPRKDNRFRCQFRFWLDANKPDELALGHELTALKKKREYLPTVRDAIRLFLSLLKGETELLREMFPMVVTQIEYEMLKSETDDDKDDLRKEIQELRRDIAEQNQKIIPLFDNKSGLVMAGQKPKLGGLQKMSLPLIADDDGDTIELKRGSENNGANFMNSVGGFLWD